MKKFLAIIFLVFGSFIFGSQSLNQTEIANRWVKVKSEVPLVSGQIVGFQVSEMMMFCKDVPQQSKVLFGTFESQITKNAMVIILESEIVKYQSNGMPHTVEFTINYPLTFQIDNKKPIAIKGISFGPYMAAYESEDKNLKIVLDQMKRGKNVKISFKIKEKNRSIVIPLNGFRKLYK